FGFLLPAYTRLLIMLSLPDFRQNSRTLALPFKAAQSTVQRFILADFYFCHKVSFPPSAARISIQNKQHPPPLIFSGLAVSGQINNICRALHAAYKVRRYAYARDITRAAMRVAYHR